ncbi:MAG: SpoIIE family protein phosphatase [Acidobacteriota bacterium]
MKSQFPGERGSRQVLLPVDHPGPRVPLSSETVRLGRDASCDVVIADLTVSRRHARLTWDGSATILEDLGSSGGTFLNGARVERAVVRAGDVIRFGPRVEYRLESEERTTTLELETRRRGGEEGVRHLQVMLEVARAINAATVLDEVLDIVLQAAVRLVGADRGFLVLSGKENAAPTVVCHPRGIADSSWEGRSSLLDRAIDERQTLCAGLTPEERTQSMIARGVDSAVATPLVVTRHPIGSPRETSFIASTEIIGGILVEREATGGAFSAEELAVFESLASDAALAIDSARLYREMRAKAKIEHEMALARTIQAALLRPPQPSRFARLFAYSQPARAVGGDLYFTAERSDGAVAFAVGDVSGKGVAAALIMAMVQGQLGLLHELGEESPELMAVLDRGLARFNPGNRFLTLATGLLYPDGRLRLSNGGHCPCAVVRRDGRVVLHPPDGPILGIVPDARWAARDELLEAGDAVVMYSDGITESFAPNDEEFGTDRVAATLGRLAGKSPEEIGDGLLDAAARHREGREADDDVTLLVVQFTPQAS